MKEFKTEQRISNMMKDNKNFSYEDIKKVFIAFEKLIVLKKGYSKAISRMNKQTFDLKKEEYKEKMQWINDFLRSKEIEETIFTNTTDYKTSSDDYDYYYEFKTPTQYRDEEVKRKAKKLGIKLKEELGR